ncbi:putative ripening-related protein 1 [Silene latifolia]|uniref:putative ripening-related protein 1 n=1 Tax=Silene latifolia TaxID=37657 RepID=UPI003D76B265
MKNFMIYSSFLVLLAIIISSSVKVEGQNCRSTGVFRGNSPPAEQCNSNCCVQNQVYFTFQCSPDVTNQTAGILTLKTFQNRRGMVPSKCYNKYYPDMAPVVALSTGWYNGGTRCGKVILISANGRSVKARVVGECDSTKGCDTLDGYHPPCGYDIVAASNIVWRALGVPPSQSGKLSITWADA